MFKTRNSNNNIHQHSHNLHKQTNKQCCCQNIKTNHSLKTKITSSDVKNKYKKIMENRKYNRNFVNHRVQQYQNGCSDVVGENFVLRTENDYLKKQLYAKYRVQIEKKQQKDSKTLTSEQNQTQRTYKLHDKLYDANRNLQQCLLQIDSRQKTNEILYQTNIILQKQYQQLKIKYLFIQQEIFNIKKYYKKYNRSDNLLCYQKEFYKVLEDKKNLMEEKQRLCQEVLELKEIIRRYHQNTIVAESDCLSPKWIANTSTKINIIEKNIAKLQQQSKQNAISHATTCISKQLSQQCQDEIYFIRKQILSATKALKFQAQTFRFGNSVYEELMASCNSPIILLIKNLCEILVESLQVRFIEVVKDVQRKLKWVGNKVGIVVQKMQNIIIKVQNNKLLQKNRGRQQF